LSKAHSPVSRKYLSLLLGTGRVAAVGIACGWFPGHEAARLITP